MAKRPKGANVAAEVVSTGQQPRVARSTQLAQADSLRVAGYRAYLDFYNGYQWDGLPAPNEKRLTFNYARVVVNKAASYLMGKGVGFAVTPPDGSGDDGKRTVTCDFAVEQMQLCSGAEPKFMYFAVEQMQLCTGTKQYCVKEVPIDPHWPPLQNNDTTPQSRM
jgi:hypothetical protein